MTPQEEARSRIEQLARAIPLADEVMVEHNIPPTFDNLNIVLAMVVDTQEVADTAIAMVMKLR